MKIARVFLSLMLLTSIVACSSDDAKEQEMNDKKAAEAKASVQTYKAKLICPQVAIVRSLDTIRDFGAEKPAASDLVAAARMQNVDGDCGYQDTGIDIRFTLDFKGARGPRLGGNKAEFPFFIAVLDPAGDIVTKNQMTERFNFKSDQKLADVTEPLHVFIPLTKEQKPSGGDYRVLMGFQLTEEQLAEVRKAQAKAVPQNSK